MADELDRLDQLLTKQEKRIAKAIREYLAIANSSAIVAVVTDLIESGRAEDAIQLLASYVKQIGDVLPSIWQEVGQSTADELKSLIPEIAVGISFDVTFPRAADLIRQNRLSFITAFTDAQRQTVRQALARSAMEGSGVAEVARSFREAVGLAPLQERAVANYRRLLQLRSSEALNRELRDRRFDDRVRQAVELDRPLTQRQIDLMVSRYRQRTIIMRTENIARTEAHDAFSAARLEALEQMVEQTGISRERIIRIWNVTRDKRLREHHATMSGQERKLGETFEDGLGNQLRRPGDPAAPANTKINCRCTETFRIAKAA
jgi:hypothetical protein